MSLWVFFTVLIFIFVLGLFIGLVIQWKREPDDEVLDIAEEIRQVNGLKH